MLRDVPRHLPPLSMMLADLGHPSPRLVAAALGVSVRTVQRWQAADHAPRAALVAIFWSTCWGRSAADCRAHNMEQAHRGLAAALTRENAALRHELARVVALGDFGAANAPTGPAMALPARLVAVG